MDSTDKKLIEEFLKKGGKIQKIEEGKPLQKQQK